MDKDFRNYLIFAVAVLGIMGIGGLVDSHYKHEKEMLKLEIKRDSINNIK